MVARGRVRLLMLPLSAGIALAVATSGTRAGIITVIVSAAAFALIAAASRNAVRVIVGLTVGSIARLRRLQLSRLAHEHGAPRAVDHAGPGSLDVLAGAGTERPHLRRVRHRGIRSAIGVGSVGPAAIGAQAGTLSPQALNTETEWNFLVLEAGLARRSASSCSSTSA